MSDRGAGETKQRERQARFPSAQVRGKIITGHHSPGHLPPKYYRPVSQTRSEECLKRGIIRYDVGRETEIIQNYKYIS